MLYGCETWSLTLMKTMRAKGISTQVSVANIWRQKRNGELSGLHIEEFHDSFNIVRVIKCRELR